MDLKKMYWYFDEAEAKQNYLFNLFFSLYIVKETYFVLKFISHWSICTGFDNTEVHSLILCTLENTKLSIRIQVY